MTEKDRGEKLRAASINISKALFDAKCITEKEKIWLIDRINRGDKSAYEDLRLLLLNLAAELGR
jgi:hypothetical protein